MLKILSKLLREGGEINTVAQVAQILNLSNDDAAKNLARWSKQGWLQQLDPANKSGRLVTKWHLFVPEGLQIEGGRG